MNLTHREESTITKLFGKDIQMLELANELHYLFTELGTLFSRVHMDDANEEAAAIAAAKVTEVMDLVGRLLQLTESATEITTCDSIAALCFLLALRFKEISIPLTTETANTTSSITFTTEQNA